MQHVNSLVSKGQGTVQILVTETVKRKQMATGDTVLNVSKLMIKDLLPIVILFKDRIFISNFLHMHYFMPSVGMYNIWRIYKKDQITQNL